MDGVLSHRQENERKQSASPQPSRHRSLTMGAMPQGPIGEYPSRGSRLCCEGLTGFSKQHIFGRRKKELQYFLGQMFLGVLAICMFVLSNGEIKSINICG